MSGDPIRAVLDALPLAICAFDGEHRLVYINDLTFELANIDRSVLPLGAALPEVLRVLAYRGFYGAGDPEAQVAAALALDRSRPFRRLTRGVRGRWFDTASIPLPGGGFAACAHEVTAEKRNEQALRERAARLESVLATLSGGVALHDEAQRLVLHNPAFESLMGATAQMLADQPPLPELMQRLHEAGEFPDAAEAAALAATLAGERRAVRRAQRQRPDRAVIRYASVPMPDGGFLVEANDITALKRAEDEAHGRAAMLQAVISALPHGVCVYGPDRRLTIANDAYARIMEGAPIAIGEHLIDIVRRRAADGEYGPGDPAEIERLQLGFSLSRPRATQRVRPNGTAIDVRTAPLPDGGHISVVTDITAIYRAEEEARRRTAILETMLETMRHGIMLFGPDRRLVAANALAERMAGLDPGGLQPGILFDDLAHDSHRRGALGEGAEGEALYRRMLEMDRSQPGRYTRSGLDGRMLEVTTDPTPDGGFVITQVDITALASAEEEAQRRADLQQSILDNFRYGVILFDADRRLTACNALAATLSGVPQGGFRVGRTIDEIMTEAAREGYLDAANATRIINADRSVQQTHRRVRRDGMVLETTSHPVADGGFVVVLNDVTKLAAAEAEAEHRSRLLRSMLDNIRHGVCLFDSAGRVVAANALAARMSGLTPEEMAPGVPLETLRRIQAERGEFGPPEETARMLADRTAQGWTVPQRYVRRRSNGDMLDVTTDAVPGGGYIRTYSDVTADYAIRAELESAREEAVAGSQAKSRFLAAMSHELRTPLDAIVGLAGRLTKAGVTAAEAERCGRAIQEAGENLRALIDDILDVARAESKQLDLAASGIAPGEVVAEAARMMEAQAAQAGLTMTVSIAEALSPVAADARRLLQVLVNLLQNAVTVTPAGGTVALSVRAEAGSIHFQVEDTGSGVPDGVAQPGDPLVRRYPGSGIGLHLARVLAEAQGGTLTVECRPGQGTTARLALPEAGRDVAASESRRQGATA